MSYSVIPRSTAMDPPSNFLFTVATVIPHFGIGLILFFITLVLFSKKNRTIEGYFLAVASNSIFDLLYSTVTVVVQMDSFYKDGFFVFAIRRFDYELNPILTRMIISGYLFAGHMCMHIVCIPFYIRYFLICKRQNVHYTIRTLLYSFAIVYDIGTSMLFYLAFEPSPRELIEYQMKPYLKGNEDGKYWNFTGARVVGWNTTLKVVITSNYKTLWNSRKQVLEIYLLNVNILVFSFLHTFWLDALHVVY